VGLFAWYLRVPKEKQQEPTKTDAGLTRLPSDVAAHRQPDVVRGVDSGAGEVDSGAGVVELGGVPLKHVVAVDQVVEVGVEAAAAVDTSGGAAPVASGDAEAVEDFADASEYLEDVDHPIPHEAPEYLKAYLRLFHTKYPNRVWEGMDADGAERITPETINAMSDIMIHNKRIVWDKNRTQLSGMIKLIYKKAYNNSLSDVNLMKILNRNKNPKFFNDLKDSMETNIEGFFTGDGTSPIPWQTMCVAALLFYIVLNNRRYEKLYSSK
jgi:hypothetical protein